MNKKRRFILKNILIIGAAFFVFGSGIFMLWASTLTIPTLTSFEERRVSQSTKIYDRTGEILLFDVYENIKRTVVPYENISRHIKNATVAIEDDTFFEHSGIRPLRTIKAVFDNLVSGDLLGGQGGSTITQQVVKNSLLTTEKKISRKFKEWVLAVRLERMLSKDEILNIYLNESPYGGSVYGVEEASQRFFGKKAADVTVAEAAYLAALPQAPTYYSPYGSHKDDLENRKNLVLSQMLKNGFITEAEYETAKNEVVVFRPLEEQNIKAPHFVLYVRELLAEQFGEEILENGGLEVITTLNYDFQQKAEEIVKKHALENEKKFNAENAGLVAIDPRTGEILTMVGSRDYFDEEIDGNFNIATALRQPGSVFKPFAYATAFKKGYLPDTVLFNVQTQFSTSCSPTNFTSENGCYAPVNYDGVFSGPMTMREALAQSVNVPSVKTLYLAGMRDTLALAKDMGIETLTDISRYGLTLVLGGGEVRLVDVVSAYGTFANEGVRYPHKAILEVRDAKGNTVFTPPENVGNRVLDRNVALQISDVLSDNAARSPAFGEQSYLYFPGREVAAKTGTTNDYRDAWIVGYTPDIAVGAWAGNNNNTPMEKRVAGFIVAPMWNEFMNTILPEYPNDSILPDPAPIENRYALKPVLRGVWSGGISHLIDKTNGKLATEETPEEAIGEITTGGVHSILYWVDTNNPRGPKPENPADDPQFVLWETAVRNWVQSHNIRESDEGDVPDEISDAHEKKNRPKLEIVDPEFGDVFDLNEKVRVSFEAESKFPISRVDFYVNGNLIGSSNQKPFTFSFIPKQLENIHQENTLKVVIYDSVFNKDEDSVNFEVTL